MLLTNQRWCTASTWCATLAISALCGGLPATAQQANRPITIIVPYTPGENTPDILARLVGAELQARWKQPVVVENMPGASGNIGTNAAARAAPDGNTIVVVTNSFAQNVVLFKSIPYDPIKDFVPVIQLADVSFGLFVHTAVPAATATEFLQHTKAAPGKLNYSSPGRGTPHHLLMEMFKLSTGADLTHVPYKGVSPAVQDLVGGHVQAMFLPVSVGVPLAQGGKVKMLGIADSKRLAAVPTVPTMAEQGVSGLEVRVWNGILAPKATPASIVGRYNETINDILRSAAVTETLNKRNIQSVGGSDAAFGGLIQRDLVFWAKTIRDAKITPE